MSTLTDRATQMIEALHAATPRAEKRRVFASEAADLVGLMASAMESAAAADARCVGTVYGGFVPGAYRGAAESDFLRITVLRVDGAWDIDGATVECDRRHAQRRPRGEGNTTVVRLARAGQRDGRIV